MILSADFSGFTKGMGWREKDDSHWFILDGIAFFMEYFPGWICGEDRTYEKDFDWGIPSYNIARKCINFLFSRISLWGWRAFRTCQLQVDGLRSTDGKLVAEGLYLGWPTVTILGGQNRQLRLWTIFGATSKLPFPITNKKTPRPAVKANRSVFL